jgi:hypothetical protein
MDRPDQIWAYDRLTVFAPALTLFFVAFVYFTVLS